MSIEVGIRIKKCRIGMNMTQKDLAIAADISKTHMSAVESGIENISNDALCRIACALNTSFDYLKEGDLKALERDNKRKERKNMPQERQIEGQMSIFDLEDFFVA